jgi:hypothetical protein
MERIIRISRTGYQNDWNIHKNNEYPEWYLDKCGNLVLLGQRLNRRN